MKNYILLLLILFLVACGKSDKNTESASVAEILTFTAVDEVWSSPIKQQIHGTCWAFSTASFLESEIYRTKGEFIELSAMYFVRNAYLQKAENYILRQGAARFTEGGCNYDPLTGFDKFGLIPQEAYQGLANGNTDDHAEMIKKLPPPIKEFANPDNKLGAVWRTEVPAIIDKYMGKVPDTFDYAGGIYSAKSFPEYTGLKADDYINITSFTHTPQDEYFVLQIPANWSNMHYFNLSLDEYMANIDHALSMGYSLAIDTDFIEPGVYLEEGYAVVPDSSVTPEKRQLDFESFATTDDHNMHLVGKATDQYGNIFYKCKNSWGEYGLMKGYIYLSYSFVKLKSIYVMLHKEGLLETTREKVTTNSPQ